MKKIALVFVWLFSMSQLFSQSPFKVVNWLTQPLDETPESTFFNFDFSENP